MADAGDPICRTPAPRLLERVRIAMRVKHYSPRTEDGYVAWIRRFILFNDRRHPDTWGITDVNRFLEHLAVQKHVSASTQTQACSALRFLYGEVLGRACPSWGPVVRAKRDMHLPVVLTRHEVEAVLEQLYDPCRLMAALMYGSGFRLTECCTLRVKDVDLECCQITVRAAKGARDRVTMLPQGLMPTLAKHLTAVAMVVPGDAALHRPAEWRAAPAPLS